MDKIKELKIDKKKYLDIAIIFACIIAITLVGTFALKLWTSTNNTELTFRIGEYSTEGITCKSGEDVTISNIGPVFDYEKDGEVITFNVVTASSNTTPLNVSFNISTITDNLKETSFKYALMSSTDKTNYTEILKGDFSNISSGSSITLIEDKVVTATTYYKLIIYIDGNMENPTSMQNGSLTGNVEMCIEGGDIVIDSFKVDGVETTKFPLSSGYDINTTCSDATIAFDYKSQSYEISNISKSKVKCGFNYTTKTNKTYLNDYIKSLAGTTQGNGQLVNEQIDVYGNVDSPITSITNYSQYKATSSSATSGTTISDYSVTNSSGSDPATITFNSSTLDSTYYYMFKYNINEDGEYSVNINVPSYTAIGCSGCGIRGSYVEDVSFYINSTEAETIAITATGSSKKNLGNLSSGDTIKVIYKLNYVNNTIITVPSPSGGSEVMSNKTSSRSSDVLPMAVSGTPTGTPNSFNVKFYKTTEGVAGTESTGYRYEGKNPNNYIYFNNELWRIIGVFDETSHGKTGEYLTKIIRNDSLGGYAWDKSKKNNWATSSLYNLLNTNYYNATDGTGGGNCYQYSTSITGNCDYIETGLQSEYRAMVENVTWYLGGKDNGSYTAEAFYIGERDSTSIYSGNTASITGYIGLMYASDYGYSVLSSSCARTTNLGSYNTSACGGSSWLKNGTYEWTVTHYSASSNSSFNLSYTAYLNYINANRGYTTRPVLYLNSNVQKISGSGTITDPYKIGY